MSGRLYDRIGAFTAIPNSVMRLIPSIGAEAFTLFSYLRFMTNAQSETAWPSYDTIQAGTGLHRRKIARAIRVLEAHGLMRRTKRFGSSTIYELTLPDPASSSTVGTKVVPPSELPVVPPSELPVVPPLERDNKTDLTKIEGNKNKPLRRVKNPPDAGGQASLFTPEEVGENGSPNPDESSGENDPAWKDEGELTYVEVLPDGSRKAKTEHAARFDALASVTGTDPKAAGGYIAKTAKDLGAGGYTPEEIERWYGPGGWYYKVRCAGVPNPGKPTLSKVATTIALAKAWEDAGGVVAPAGGARYGPNYK